MAHRWKGNVSSMVAGSEGMESLEAELCNWDSIRESQWWRKRNEKVLATKLTKRGSWWQRDSNMVVLR
jgi:hypothetical protein